MKPVVVVTRNLPGDSLNRVREKCEVRINLEERVMTRDELLDAVRGCSGILCLLSDTIDGAVMDSAGSGLKVISNYAVGYNNIDVTEATKRGIAVCNTPGVLTEATADMTWALLLACARRIVEADRFVRQGLFKGWAPELFLGYELHGKTLGISGMGRIGEAVARRARGFGMRIIYSDERASAFAEEELGAKRVDKETLLRESDFLSLHLPLTDDTRHYIGEAELALMKRTCILVNASRGPVLDEAAVAKALKESRIAAAGLDVYEREPIIEGALLDLDNAVLAPHLGSATLETRTRMAEMAVKNLLDVLGGVTPEHCVNREALSL